MYHIRIRLTSNSYDFKVYIIKFIKLAKSSGRNRFLFLNSNPRHCSEMATGGNCQPHGNCQLRTWLPGPVLPTTWLLRHYWQSHSNCQPMTTANHMATVNHMPTDTVNHMATTNHMATANHMATTGTNHMVTWQLPTTWLPVPVLPTT